MIQLDSFISQFKDKSISVAMYDLQTQREILINADEIMHPASTMKVPGDDGSISPGICGLAFTG